MRSRRTAGAATREVLENVESGLARVALPSGWRRDAFLRYDAAMQAADRSNERFCLVISEPRNGCNAATDLLDHSARTLEFVTRSAAVQTLRGPGRRQVAGFEALQYEMEATGDRTPLVYLHTTIAGQRAFHQVLCWSPRATYDRAAFEELLNAFEESSEPCVQPGAPRLMVAQSSAYPVH